jgi:hypothetical protein
MQSLRHSHIFRKRWESPVTKLTGYGMDAAVQFLVGQVPQSLPLFVDRLLLLL